MVYIYRIFYKTCSFYLHITNGKKNEFLFAPFFQLSYLKWHLYSIVHVLNIVSNVQQVTK